MPRVSRCRFFGVSAWHNQTINQSINIFSRVNQNKCSSSHTSQLLIKVLVSTAIELSAAAHHVYINVYNVNAVARRTQGSAGVKSSTSFRTIKYSLRKTAFLSHLKTDI
jgi:hypothetical protein